MVRAGAAGFALFLAGCGRPGLERKPPLFVQDGVQGDDCVYLEAGLALHRPGPGWSFLPGSPCVLSGPGGVTVVLEARAIPPEKAAVMDPVEWSDRLEDLRAQGFETAEGPWESLDPPASGKILAAWKKNQKGHYDAVCEARGISGKAALKLYVRGLWSASRPPSWQAGEARLLLNKVHKEFLIRFDPLPPMAAGEESLLVQALLDRWLSALNRADLHAYLACFHSESPGLALEKEVFQKKSGNLFKKTFAEGVRPGPWAAARESLIVDGSEAVMIVRLFRHSKTGEPLQEIRLKGRLRREAAAWKILLWEALI